MNFKQKIIDLLKKETKLKELQLEIPPDIGFGDYSFPCFQLSKQYTKEPHEIAKYLDDKLVVPNFLEKIEATGPYLNFFINKSQLAEKTINQILKEKDKYGSTDNKGKKALVEHTSINPNASPHVGRSRNAIIGDFFVRLLKFLNYKVETHYFVNDVGKQISMLVLAAENKKNITFDKLLDLYVNINKEIEENPELEQKVFDLLNKLENGDKEVKKKFKDIVDICIKGQTKILNELDIGYDFFDYESIYLWNKRTEEILAQLKKTNKLFEDADKRYVLNLKGYNLAMKEPVLVLTRADKTSLYPLRDLAYTIDKMKKNPKNNIIVLGEDQKLYFQQLKAALDLLEKKAPEVIHYSFVLLSEGKMSTRKGTVVLLEDLMKEALKKAEKELAKRYKKVDKNRAKSIAYGAIKYSLLKVSPDKNVAFNLDEALAFEGDTGPYIQYTYARASSILAKTKANLNKIAFNLLTECSEINLIKQLNQFPKIIDDSLKQLKPNIVANYAYLLAQSFTEFYHNCPVKDAEQELKKARIALVKATKQVIKNALNILGIEAPDQM